MTRKEAEKQVMIIEDDPAIRTVMGIVLEDAGYRVTMARDGRDALKLLEHEAPGLILLDARMPVMDGREFSRQLHARWHHKVPIITVTADTHPAELAADLEADDYLEKPFDIDELVDMVRGHFPL